MSPPSAEAAQFAQEGNIIVGQAAVVAGDTANRRFRSFFGATPQICARLWEIIRSSIPHNSQPRHLLWALLFLKLYASEHVNGTLTKADEKTFRKWFWTFVEVIARHKLVNWNDRLPGREAHQYKASVDGVDFDIEEPSPFNPAWYSHKFKGPGVRYEVAVGIESGNIVLAHGPFPCGAWNDLKIYQSALKDILLPNEKLVADGGYIDETTAAGSTDYSKGDWGYIRARHEAVNKRLKQFMVLSRRFRHRLQRHADCFYAVLNISFLLIKYGEPVFW